MWPPSVLLSLSILQQQQQMAMGNKQTEIGPSTRPRREEQKPRMACDERREIAETHRRNDRQPHGENVQNHIICLPTLKMNEYKNELFNYWRGPRVQRIHHVSCAHTEDRLVSFSCGLIFCSHFFICLSWLQSRKKKGGGRHHRRQSAAAKRAATTTNDGIKK